MDSSIRGQGSATQQDPKGLSASLRPLASIFEWLASLIKLTAAEQEEAGIYLGRPGDE